MCNFMNVDDFLHHRKNIPVDGGNVSVITSNDGIVLFGVIRYGDSDYGLVYPNPMGVSDGIPTDCELPSLLEHEHVVGRFASHNDVFRGYIVIIRKMFSFYQGRLDMIMEKDSVFMRFLRKLGVVEVLDTKEKKTVKPLEPVNSTPSPKQELKQVVPAVKVLMPMRDSKGRFIKWNEQECRDLKKCDPKTSFIRDKNGRFVKRIHN